MLYNYHFMNVSYFRAACGSAVRIKACIKDLARIEKMHAYLWVGNSHLSAIWKGNALGPVPRFISSNASS